MKVAGQPSQAVQRVKVGLLGLAAVILLIALASAVLRTASHEAPVAAAGGAKADVVANMALDNGQAASGGEPLAELGMAPASGNTAAIAAGR